MPLICACPKSAALTAIPATTCLESFGATFRVAFQRLRDDSGNLNGFTIATANPNVLASWTAAKAQTDSTKIVIGPLIDNPVHEDAGRREYGGDTTTRNGVPITLGENPTPFSCDLLRLKQDIIVALKALMCEEGDLGIYLFNGSGLIAGSADDLASPTVVRPFEIQGFYQGSKILGNFNTPDMNKMSWQFAENWSDTFHTVTPTDFNPLTQL